MFHAVMTCLNVTFQLLFVNLPALYCPLQTQHVQHEKAFDVGPVRLSVTEFMLQ